MEPRQAHLPESLFGSVDPALPNLIGQIVMIAALLEHKVAVLASSVQDLPQNHYFAQDFSRNREVCRQRFAFFSGPGEREVVRVASAFIRDVATVLDKRNQLVHRVWAQAESEPWGGHKAPRGVGTHGLDTWRNYSHDELFTTIRQMTDIADRSSDVVGRVTALPRLPSPYKFATAK
jgi:hypothetical protein